MPANTSSSPQTSFSQLLKPARPGLAALAESWFNQGATAFEVWSEDGEKLAGWYRGTPNQAGEQPYIQTPVSGPGLVRLYLRVSGSPSLVWQNHLAAEARLVGQLIRLEAELDEMTTEFISSQDQLLALYDLSWSLRRHLGIKEVLETLAWQSARLTGTPYSFAILGEGEPAGSVIKIDLENQGGFPLSDEQLATLWQGVNASRSELVLTEAALPGTAQNLLLLPVLIRDDFSYGLGLLDRPGGFNSPDLKLVRAIVQQGASQLETVLLYQETLAQARLKAELEIAAQVQLQLLPQRPPVVKGLDVRACSQPALVVGGDFYDFVDQPNRPFIFGVGDVTGKGMSAALLMSVSRAVLHNVARSMAEPEPTAIVEQINENLYDDFNQVRMFATLFVGQYEPTSRQFSYANAGHSPVIYCPVGGPARLLEADSPPLGVLPTTLCETQHLPLVCGDVLVVATDGFSEATNQEGELFGYERLLRAVEEVAHGPASAREIANSLYTQVASFALGLSQEDDQTIFVIKVI